MTSQDEFTDKLTGFATKLPSDFTWCIESRREWGQVICQELKEELAVRGHRAGTDPNGRCEIHVRA